MVEASNEGGNWMVNPKGHPQPTLPDQSYLEGDYLTSIKASSPHLVEEVRELVTYAGKERGG